jgi:hypothetical protein
MLQQCNIEQACPRDWTSMRLIRCQDHHLSVQSSVVAGQTRRVIMLRRILRSTFQLLRTLNSPEGGRK